MATLIAIALFLQDSIYETRHKHQKDLLAIPGVKSVSIGGVDGKMAIVVTVESDAASDAVVAKYGETLDSHRLHVIVSGGSKKTETKPAKSEESKPTVVETGSVPGTLRDYSIPYFPGKKPATTTTTTPERTPEEQEFIDRLLPKPKKKEETTTPTTTTETGPGRNRTTTTTTGPTRTTTTTTQDGPRWSRPTGTTTTGVPTRTWTPSGGNTITRNTGGSPT